MAGQATCGSGAAACIAADLARAFVAGGLRPAERAAVERRIAVCDACRAVVAEVAGGATAPLRGEPRPPAVRSPALPPAALVDDRGDVVGAVRRAAPRVEAAAVAPAAPRADTALSPGDVVGRYVVERPIGAGGMGVVSLARDPELRRPVVIKLVHPDVGSGDAGGDSGEGRDEFEARLRREAQAMAQVSHANVVQIFDIGRRGDRVFLAMEFVAGTTLDGWLRERRRTPDEILDVIRQAGAGLAAAHRAGLVHRDFKPSNVLVGNDGVVKVTDFGLARSLAAGPVGGSGGGAGGAAATRQMRAAGAASPRTDAVRAPQPSGVHAVLTEVNAVVGTPAYMAPEQAAGAALDARTDQYALAVTLLDALLAQAPSRRSVAPRDPPAAIDAALQVAEVAPAVRAAILRALAQDPAARFASVDALLAAIAPAVQVPPVAPPAAVAPRRRRAAFAIAGVVLCGGGAAAWWIAGRGASDCAAEAPARWTTDARARVVAAQSAGPRAFSGWDAERVAGAIDRAVGGLATAETARCRGAVPAGRDAASAECIAQREAALAAALPALSATPPVDDPWPRVRAIERCDPPAAVAEAATLRGQLRGATAVQARAIAEAAHRLGDAELVGDASEVSALAALAAGDAALAGDELRAMNAAALEVGSAAAQGRMLLHSIALRRVTGEYDLAAEHRVALEALLERYRDAPRDVLAAALVEGEAFGDLGDVATAFAAWDRAQAAAEALGDRDAALAAAIGRARAMAALRRDGDGARAAATAALAAASAASPAARAAALGSVADLAIAAGDGRGAAATLDQARQLDPARAGLGAGRVRAQRVRALLGDVDGALAELVVDPSDDPLTAARIRIARGEILVANDHAREAVDVLEQAALELRSGEPRGGEPRIALPIIERLDLEIAACEARQAATGDAKTFRLAPLVAGLHKRAPARARVELLEASVAPPERPAVRGYHLNRALEILVDAGAAPVALAELRWELAQLCLTGADCRGLATAARAAFQAAGRTAEVAEIDRWLADAPGAPGAPPGAGSSAAGAPAGTGSSAAIAPPGAGSGAATAPPVRRELPGPQP